MRILPAIDILDGKVVRLFQGNYAQAKFYSHDPAHIAQTFSEQGYSSLHVIDLAGAKLGSPQALKEIKAILALDLEIQVGGGIRSLQTVHEYLDLGVKRVIIGTQALQEPSFIDELLKAFPSKSIIVSLDVRNGKLATNGWLQEHPHSIEMHLNLLEKQGIKQVIITDITRDGTLSGINSSLYKPVVKAFQNLDLYAAGGITSQSDIEQLEQMGMAGAIIGRSFYEQNLGVKIC
jgi:phosphoribosylformimino-5-aminoimidazole carboxamide ribotide isomerase